MKKIIITIIICIITFGIIFLNINSKENKKEENENISIILETEEGNIESNTFPSKEEYEYSKVVCENTNNNIEPIFNTDTWKLNVSVEEESIDGNFQCNIYFKEKTYEVKTSIENGVIDENMKVVKRGDTVTFNITPNTDHKDIEVSCTNNQNGSINGNTLTVSNVTANTTCLVKCNKSKYEFDFTNANTLNDFEHIEGGGEFGVNCSGASGLCRVKTLSEAGYNKDTLQYTLDNNLDWDNFKFTIEYRVGNYDDAMGRFEIILGNFNYSFRDDWAYTPTGANLYSKLGSEYILNYIMTESGVGTFDGTVIIEKNGTNIGVSEGYNQSVELNENINLEGDKILISMENSGEYYSTVMRIRKIIIEKL